MDIYRKKHDFGMFAGFTDKKVALDRTLFDELPRRMVRDNPPHDPDYYDPKDADLTMSNSAKYGRRR